MAFYPSLEHVLDRLRMSLVQVEDSAPQRWKACEDARSFTAEPAEEYKLPFDETGVRLRQVEAEDMQLHAHAADDADAFAEVDLRMARRMGERHENLARSGVGVPNVILHDRIAAGVAVFDPQPFENPLGRMPLLRRRRLVGFQDRVDDRNERSELRPLWSLGPHIAGRRRIPAHFGNRVPAQPKDPRRLAPALPFDKDKPSNRCVNLHREHPRPSLFESEKRFGLESGRVLLRHARPRHAAAPWPTIAPPRTLCPRQARHR